MNDRLFFRQLTSGQEFACGDPFAQQMVNHCYCIGDRQTSEVILVDPAYDVASILAHVRSENMEPVGIVLTHYHADHAGGSIAGYEIEGAGRLLESTDIPVHVNSEEVEYLGITAGLGPDQLRQHKTGDTVGVGQYEIELIHTPGHTPGSQCLLVEGRLLSGDTLFLNGCGRTDLPGGDPIELYNSLTHRLSKVADDVTLFPGHHYSEEYSGSMGNTRLQNSVFRPKTEEDWLNAFAP